MPVDTNQHNPTKIIDLFIYLFIINNYNDMRTTKNIGIWS